MFSSLTYTDKANTGLYKLLSAWSESKQTSGVGPASSLISMEEETIFDSLKITYCRSKISTFHNI